MILIDTSVWVDHLRALNPQLSKLLNQGEVLTRGRHLTHLPAYVLA